MLGLYWGTIRVILIGVILRLHWGNIGIILGLYWGQLDGKMSSISWSMILKLRQLRIPPTSGRSLRV